VGESSKRILVLTKIMKWTSLFVLLGAAFFWSPGGNYGLLLQFVVCGGAGLVTLEAAKSGKHLWTAAFAALAVLFNPLGAVTFFHAVFPWVAALCCSLFLAALFYLKAAPRLSMVSITYPGPRSQSL
jgi:uncharacterized protein DUF6804